MRSPPLSLAGKIAGPFAKASKKQGLRKVDEVGRGCGNRRCDGKTRLSAVGKISRVPFCVEDGDDNNPLGLHQVEDQIRETTEHCLSGGAMGFWIEFRAGSYVIEGAIDFGTKLATQVGKLCLVPFDRLFQFVTCFKSKDEPSFFHGLPYFRSRLALTTSHGTTSSGFLAWALRRRSSLACWEAVS